MTLGWVYALIGILALQRLAELVHARRNTARLLAAGGTEIGRRHYPLFILLHGAWFAALILLAQPTSSVPWIGLGVLLLLQMARFWVIRSLGPYWTTRIITTPSAPLRRRGPYRWVEHPNYLVVEAEIVLVPLLLDLPVVAVVFGLLNAALLTWRIHVEGQALAPRRALSASD